MCGLPPFVDEMIDVFIDDDMVVVGVPRLFTRPLRLTAPRASRWSPPGGPRCSCPAPIRDGPLGRGLAEAGGRARRRRRRRRPAAAAGGRRRRSTRCVGGRSRRPSGCASSYWTPSRDEVTRAHDHAAPRRSTTAASGTSSPTTSARASGARSASTASSRSSATGEHDAVEADGAGVRRAGLVRRRRPAAGDAAAVSRRPAGSSSATRSTRRRAARRRRRGHVPGRQRALAGAAAAAARAGRPRCSRRPRGGRSRPTWRSGCSPATPSAGTGE